MQTVTYLLWFPHSSNHATCNLPDENVWLVKLTVDFSVAHKNGTCILVGRLYWRLALERVVILSWRFN